MAPHGESINPSPYVKPITPTTNNNNLSKPPPLAKTTKNEHNTNNGLHRTVSDISFEISKEALTDMKQPRQLPPISEVEDAKCECCGMSEECTPEYIERVRKKYAGKWVCGLCGEAVKEEMEKNGVRKTLEDALSTHMSACSRFNNFGRAYPVLFQAEAMREMLKKSTRRANSFGPKGTKKMAGGIARSSSCIPAITRDMNDLGLAN